MKKRKITYSPTARQKKQRDVQTEPPTKPEVTNEEAIARRQKTKTIVCIAVAAVLAVVLITVAILIPVLSMNETVTDDTFLKWQTYNPETGESEEDGIFNSNPIATITITGDDKTAFRQLFGKDKVDLEFEIFMDSAPYAGMNFLYLAESGFYNNTIISYVHGGKAMFCGFTEAKNGSNRALEENFILNLKGFVNHRQNTPSFSNDSKDFKLGYRLRREYDRRITGDVCGFLTMIASNSYSYSSSTAFMMFTNSSPQYDFLGLSSVDSYLSWVGKTNNEESKAAMAMIDSLNSELSGKFYKTDWAVRITSIKTNLSAARKNYLKNNFERLLTCTENAGAYVDNWTNNAYNESYYCY